MRNCNQETEGAYTMTLKLIANIVNFDGIDFCVAENVRQFYTRLGCVPVVARSIVEADILVILRGSCDMVDCSKYQEVHVFNYVGQNRSRMVLRNVQRLVYIEVSPSLESWRPSVDRPPDLVIAARHPVYPELWTRRIIDIEHEITHVGNYKRIGSGQSGADQIQQKMVEFVTKHQIPVWGRNWGGVLPESCLMGPVSLWKVLDLYAQTRISLGIRYPEQRTHRLISSRYWLATLNGCPILSDEDSTGDEIPGVIFRPYDHSLEYSASLHDRMILAENARMFWIKETLAMEESLRPRIGSLSPVTSATRQHLTVRFKYFAEVMARKVKSRIE